MTTEGISSSLIGLTTGVASAVMQTAVPQPTHAITPFVVPVTSAIVGGLVSFVALRTTVMALADDLKELKRDVKDNNTRLARIEGRIGVEE